LSIRSSRELLPARGHVPLARRRPSAAPYEARLGSRSLSRTRTHTGLRSTCPGPRAWSSLPASSLNRAASVRPDFLGRAPGSGIIEAGGSPKPRPRPPRAAEGTHAGQRQGTAPAESQWAAATLCLLLALSQSCADLRCDSVSTLLRMSRPLRGARRERR